MQTSPVNVAHRAQTLDLRTRSQQTRCQTLASQAHILATEQQNDESKARGLFALDLIVEAQSKLIESQLVGETLTTLGERALAQLAIAERWVTSAIDLLNRAQLVVDDDQDIWGNDRPTGGLWDK